MRGRFHSCAALLVLLVGCSTALPIDVDLVDEEQEQDAALDAGSARDGAVANDSGPGRDGGPSANDAGRDAGGSTADAGKPHNCMTELPTRGFASLITDDCAKRTLLPCPGQDALDAVLRKAAQGCGVRAPADLGFTLGANGCPTQLRYEQMKILGAISACIGGQLESLRFSSCSLACAVVHF